MKRISIHRHSASGFSLLEVLVAVVILATGLLALAALQGSLARSSADAKARSRVMSMLSAEMDSLRATGYSALVPTDADGVDVCVEEPGSPSCAAVTSAASDSAIGSLTLTRTIEEFRENAAGEFEPGAPLAASDAQFREVTLEASWTDATGGTRTATTRTVMSSLALEANSPLVDDDPGGKFPTGPVVRQKNPAVAGMIPIAIGDNTDTAATNPRPELGSQSENQTLPATRYDVLTYQNETSELVRIQKRVETTVVECTCKFESTPSELEGIWALTTYRPSYWDGTKYTVPVDAGTKPSSGPYSGDNQATVTQSPLCTECCRDHHDTADDEIKYNNFNTDFGKYQATAVATGKGNTKTTKVQLVKVNGVLQLAGEGDVYIEACRLNRVDGVWRVATDLFAEHAGLLATTDITVAQSPVPDPAAAKSYEDFVKDYLGSRGEDAVDESDDPSVPDLTDRADELYTKYELASLTVDKVELDGTVTGGISLPSNDQRFLHMRGLYIDHLEEAALDRIREVAEDGVLCPRTPVDSYPGCLLPYIPFNTINMTELANWSSGNPDILQMVTGSGSVIGDGEDPIRGIAEGKGKGGALALTIDANKLGLGRSNSAVASSLAINPYELDVANTIIDSQPFIVDTSAVTNRFGVGVSGLAYTEDATTSNDPKIGWQIEKLDPSRVFTCSPSISRDDANPNDYRCVTTVALGSDPMELHVRNYNLLLQKEVDNPCQTDTAGTETVMQPILQCNTITGLTFPNASITVDSPYAVTAAGTTEETTVITLRGALDSIKDKVGVLTFEAAGETAADLTTCAADGSGQPVIVVPTSCP